MGHHDSLRAKEEIEIVRLSWGSKVDPLLADPTAPYDLIAAC
jgi:hypothetical protein